MRFITLDGDNKVIGIRNGSTICDGETQSDLGDSGQIMQEDETFIDDPQDEIRRQQALIEAKKQELIQLMIEANALRDDVAWQQYKDEYDLIV